MKIRVKVSQYHIDLGVQGDGDMSPISYALQDLGYDYVEVKESQVDFSKRESAPGPDGNPEVTYTEWTAHLPKVAQEFVSNFDKGGHSMVHPLEFEIDMHDPEE